MTTAVQFKPLKLEPISGPAVRSFTLEPQESYLLGRGATCDISLPHDTVSRRHARITPRGGKWFLNDEGGRHGTYLNAVRLTSNDAVPLDDGDSIRIGPWMFTVNLGGGRTRSAATTSIDQDQAAQTMRVERVSNRELGSLAEHRLHLLMDCAAAINEADKEEALIDAVLESSIAGSGFPRAALIRNLANETEIEVLGFRDVSGSATVNVSFSQSLIREAASGELARLIAEDPLADRGESIVRLGIHSAICAPIVVGSTIDALLYLDAREAETSVQPDAAGFCQSIARLCGMAMANLRRKDLEFRHQRLQDDLHAAREAQELIVPAEQGEIDFIRYAMRMRPGRLVAGDLFDIFRLQEGHVAVCLGDVTGEGVGAAILMATAQSHLHAALKQHGDPAAAIHEVNQYLTERTAANKFVSMWVGVFDLAAGLLTYVDAGHGHWLHLPDNAPLQNAGRDGSILVGIDPTSTFINQSLPISTGDRIVIFSDGLVEQTSPGGEQFGHERISEVITQAASAEQDVQAVFEAVIAFAETENLADDATLASIELLKHP